MHRFRGQTLRAPKPSSVLITGATGCFAEVINGFFVPTEGDGIVHVMKKRSNPTVRLFHDGDCWHIEYNCEGKWRGSACAWVSGPRQLEEFVSQSRVWSVRRDDRSFYCTDDDDDDVELLQPSVVFTILTETEALQQVNSRCQAANQNQPFPKSQSDVLILCAQEAEYASAVSSENDKAVPVFIGEVGCFDEISDDRLVSGLYEPTEERIDDRVVYKKFGDGRMCIVHSEGFWYVKFWEGANRLARVRGNCALNLCASRKWEIDVIADWDEGRPEFQSIHVLFNMVFGAEAVQRVSCCQLACDHSLHLNAHFIPLLTCNDLCCRQLNVSAKITQRLCLCTSSAPMVLSLSMDCTNRQRREESMAVWCTKN
jgi:hypothetical protein